MTRAIAVPLARLVVKVYARAMQLILMRHGQAQPKHPDVANDDRSLTRKGHRLAARTALALVQAKILPSVIWVSPWHRAMQTAVVLSRMVVPAPPWRAPKAPPPPTPPQAPSAAPARGAASVAVPAPNNAPASTPSAEAKGTPVETVDLLSADKEHWRGKRGETNLAAIVDRMAALPAEAVLAIVGHHHLLQRLVKRLTGRASPHIPLAGVLLLDDSGGAFTVQNVIDPKRLPSIY